MTSGRPIDEVRAAKAKAAELLGAMVGQVAIGIQPLGHGLYALKVNLPSDPPPETTLPTEIDGVPITVEVVGPVQKRARTK